MSDPDDTEGMVEFALLTYEDGCALDEYVERMDLCATWLRPRDVLFAAHDGLLVGKA